MIAGRGYGYGRNIGSKGYGYGIGLAPSPNLFPTAYRQVFKNNPTRLDAVLRAQTQQLQRTAWAPTNAVKMELPIYMPDVDQSGLNAILAFEAAHQTSPFQVTWQHNGRTYTVQFLSDIQVVQTPVGKYDVNMTVVEI